MQRMPSLDSIDMPWVEQGSEQGAETEREQDNDKTGPQTLLHNWRVLVDVGDALPEGDGTRTATKMSDSSGH